MYFIVSFKLGKAHCELNKRIYEHDKCMAEGKMDKRDVTLQVCDFSATFYSTHRWRNTSTKRNMTIFWKVLSFYQTRSNSRHCMNIMQFFMWKYFLFIFTLITCKLTWFKFYAIYGLSCLICTNGNTSTVSLQKISISFPQKVFLFDPCPLPLLWKFQFSFISFL